jgi:polyferredoxin
MQKIRDYNLSFWVFVFAALMLSVIQVKVNPDNPMLIFERFYKGAGWLEIFIVSFYGAFVAYKMQNPVNVPSWRIRSWTIFSAVIFGQLALGLLGFEKFLMTVKLHLPIPAMILSGPIYRGHISVMTILFLSTVILSGPAWCSQLCYFGAIDGIASGKKRSVTPIKRRRFIKHTILCIVVFVTIVLRFFSVTPLYATLLGIAFGLAGLLIILFISRRKGKMFHCVLYCPIGTMVNYLKYINPFRMYIENSCTSCMRCTAFCKYDALNVEDIKKGKPGLTCTLCGDCLSSCKGDSIRYKFFNLSAETSRKIYLFISISLHAIFLAVARL